MTTSFADVWSQVIFVFFVSSLSTQMENNSQDNVVQAQNLEYADTTSGFDNQYILKV